MITVITVAYNAGATLRDTILSVQAQNTAVEHWIIDGGSTDNTLAICSEFPHLKVLSEPDDGLYDAMNKGVKFAKGDIIGFLNADDVYAHENVTQEITEAMTDMDCCFANLEYRDTDLKRVHRFWRGSSHQQGKFAVGWAPAHPTFYMRKQAFIDMGGFSTEEILGEDVIFMLQALEKNHLKSRYVDSTWVHMRVGGISGAAKNIWRQNARIIAAHKAMGLPINPFSFWGHKICQRITQLLQHRLRAKYL